VVHHTLSPNLKRQLKSIDGGSKLDIARSTLISNEELKELGDEART
jgi:hypothetical protein